MSVVSSRSEFGGEESNDCIAITLLNWFPLFILFTGAGVKMEHHFHVALDPRKQELLEARFSGARVSYLLLEDQILPDL